MPIKTGITRILDFELTSNKGIANGYCGLDAFALVALANLPDLSSIYLPLVGGTMVGNIVMSGAQINMSGEYLNLGSPNCGLQRVLNKLQFIDPNNLGGLYLDDLHKFIGMSDVPAAYAGAGSKYVCVNAAANALEFVAAGAIPGGPYLPLIGGSLSGDLTIKKANATLFFETAVGIGNGSLQATASGLDFTAADTQNMLFSTGVTTKYFNFSIQAVDKFTIANAGMTSTIPLTIQTDTLYKLNFRKADGTFQGGFAGSTSLGLSSVIIDAIDRIFLQTENPTGVGTISFAIFTSTIMTITDTETKIYGPIYNIGATSALYFENPAGTDKGKLIPYADHLLLSSSATQDLQLDTGANTKNVIIKNATSTIVTVSKDNVTTLKDIYINSGTASGLILQRSGTDSFIFTVNAAGNAFIRAWDGTVSIGAKDSTTDIIIGYVGKNILLQNNGTTKLTIGSGITAAAAIAMGANKITGLAAATANGDAVRYEQLTTSYSMEVGFAGGEVNPLDASTYYFGRLQNGQSTTVNEQDHLRYIPKAGKITAALIHMYAHTAGTNENISVYIRLNNTTDYLIQTVGVSSTNRNFSNIALDITVAVADAFEIKVVYPTWATNAGYVNFDGTIIITT